MDELLKLYMQPAVVALAERVERDFLAMWDQFQGECPYVCGTVDPTNVGAPDWGSGLTYEDCIKRIP